MSVRPTVPITSKKATADRVPGRPQRPPRLRDASRWVVYPRVWSGEGGVRWTVEARRLRRGHVSGCREPSTSGRSFHPIGLVPFKDEALNVLTDNAPGIFVANLDDNATIPNLLTAPPPGPRGEGAAGGGRGGGRGNAPPPIHLRTGSKSRLNRTEPLRS